MSPSIYGFIIVKLLYLKWRESVTGRSSAVRQDDNPEKGAPVHDERTNFTGGTAYIHIQCVNHRLGLQLLQ